MSFTLWVTYLGAVIILSLTPGPNGLLALSQGMTLGVKRTCYSISGGVFGFALMMLLAMIGIGGIIVSSPDLFLALKLIGAGYLIILGVLQILRAKSNNFGAMEKSNAKTGLSLFAKGFFVAISNPKVILFYLAFLPQFMNTEQSLWQQFLILAATFVIVEFCFELGLAGFAKSWRRFFETNNRMAWFNRASGSLFILIGVIFGLSESQTE